MVQNRQVITLDKTRLLEALPESAQQLFVLRYGGEQPDHRHRRLLRARADRPRGSRTEHCDELAPPHLRGHSITLSARASNIGGMVMPSALAVVRLMTRSNLVGCSTGISAGCAPRRILFTNSAARRNKSGKLAP